MGGIIEGGVGIGTKTSPRRAAIEKAQVELRLEYDIREERRRELDFLEKGGNPLDFKFGIAAPLSVQSSSVADQLNDQFGTCEAKGGFSSAASPLGDSIGSSGRLGATVACEPNGADNFDGENAIIESEGKPRYASRSNNTPSEHSSQPGGSQNVRESEDSPIFHPKKAYRRRNRSKTNRDSARLSAIDNGPRGGHNSSLSDRHGVVSEAVVHQSQSDTEMDGSSAAAADPTNGGLSEGKLDMSSSKHMNDGPHNPNIKDNEGVSATITSVEPDPCMGREQKITAVSEILACSGAEKPEKDGGPEQKMEPVRLKGEGECTETEGIGSSVAVTLKGLESESSCTRTSVGVDGNDNTHSSLCTMKNVDSVGEQMEQNVPLEPTDNKKAADMILQDSNMADIAESDSCINDKQLSQSCQANGFPDKDQEEMEKMQLSAEDEAKCIPCAGDTQPNRPTDFVVGLQQGSLDDSIYKVESHCPEKPQGPHSSATHELTKTDISCSVSDPEIQLSDGNLKKVVDKAHEDRIMERARNIMAKRKIIEELSLGSLFKEYRRKTRWDFVLEEMAWMANDFAQERVWKRTAATQLCYRAAFASRLRFGEQDKHERDKVVAQTLAKAVMDFWNSAALLVGVNGNGFGTETCEHGTAPSENMGGNNANVENGGHNKDYVKKNIQLAVQGYAVRFLQLNGSVMPAVKDATSRTAEGASIIGTHEMTCQNQHAEEDLFYAVPHGAMEEYRKSVESYLVQCLRVGKNMQEVNTSMYNAVGEYECPENGYEEDEGENAYYLPGAFVKKKRKNPKLYTPRSYEVGGDPSYGHCVKNRIGIPQSAVKRPANGINVCPIPTKRVRTASRQRVVGPFSNTAAGYISLPSRTDASSGDTNSFQDDQIHGGSLIPKGLEVESGMDYDKQSAFDAAEITAKPKKKKTKHQGTSYEQRWQVDCSVQNEQRDHFKKRSESHQIDSNGNTDPFVPHAKKPKLMKQLLEHSFENTTLMSGSVASPLGSQMSNMSNPNKLIKLIGGRDRGRKNKSLKMPSVQTGSGSPWSLFEDQALVVLVHDMGPNWELVSDAINSTLHFKCIFRKPQECKERHAVLLEKKWEDGADTEDSGSSQAYPSTLPGIPKGGARQLFQQLRGPMEEDTIKSHFEKIILIGQQLHGRKKQELKQLVPVHSSHLATLSQVVTTNMNGGVLTPLDLCDISSSSPDVFSGNYQGPHTGSLSLPNQAVGQSIPPSSSNSPSLQGPSSNLASPSAQGNVPNRDGRYGVPRASMPIDEQQRIQQYNHMLSSRNLQQPNLSAGTFSGNDVGGRILPGANGMSMPRSGLQGVPGSASSNMVGMPSSLNMQPGAAVGQGNSMLRPRDALMMRVPHANSRGVPSFSGLSSGFPTQSASPSGSTYPVQQQHQMHQQHSNVLSNSHHPHLQGSANSGSTEQQAFAMSVARDRQLQQRLLQRQQQQKQQHHQQFPTSSVLMPHAPSQSQLPMSTALQNSSQATSQPVSLPPLKPSSPITPVPSQQQQKHQLSRHGRTAQTSVGGMTNQVGKQRQHQAQQLQQQQQQSGRHHPPQRQPSQSQHQAKLLKGMGRGNTLMHQQQHPVDSSHLNGLSSNPGSQPEKGEQSMHLMHGQVHPSQSSKLAVPPVSTQSHPQQKVYPNSAPASSKQVQQMHSNADSSTPSQAPAVASASAPPIIPSSNQQLKVNQHPPVKLVNHRQPNIHRAVSQNHSTNSDPVMERQNDQSQVEQQLASTSSPMSATSGIPPKCVESANAAPASETLNDSSVPNSQLGPTGNTSMSNSPGNESIAPGVHGLPPKQPLNSLAPSLGTQRKQIPQSQTTLPNQVLLPQKQQPHKPPLLEQSSQRQPPPHQHPQPQVQTPQSNFTRSSNSTSE